MATSKSSFEIESLRFIPAQAAFFAAFSTKALRSAPEKLASLSVYAIVSYSTSLSMGIFLDRAFSISKRSSFEGIGTYK